MCIRDSGYTTDSVYVSDLEPAQPITQGWEGKTQMCIRDRRSPLPRGFRIFIQISCRRAKKLIPIARGGCAIIIRYFLYGTFCTRSVAK